MFNNILIFVYVFCTGMCYGEYYAYRSYWKGFIWLGLFTYFMMRLIFMAREFFIKIESNKSVDLNITLESDCNNLREAPINVECKSEPNVLSAQVLDREKLRLQVNKVMSENPVNVGCKSEPSVPSERILNERYGLD